MPKLRIGFLAHDWIKVEPWVHRLVGQTINNDLFEVAALIVTPNHVQPPKSNWLYRVLYPMEKRIFANPVPADTKNIDGLVGNYPAIDLSNVETLTSLELDVIVSVEETLPFRECTGFAKHGVWSLDMFDFAEGFSAFAAVRGHDAVSEIGLKRFSEKVPGAELIAACSINPKFQMSRNALFMKEKSVVLILRELKTLARKGHVDPIAVVAKPTEPNITTGDIIGYYRHFAFKTAGRFFANLKRRTGIRPDKFILLTGKGDALSFDPKLTTEVVPPGNNFWADPFLWERDGKMYCFYEHYSRATKTGIIQVGEIRNDQMVVLGNALETDIHLSFPFIFEHEDELYMMPETCAAKRIEIWRCTEFPSKWELHSTTLEGESVADSMILRRDGKWWLFTNIAHDIYSDNCSELHIFEIDGPDLNQIKPHAANPVVLDSRTARNAGRFHEIDGRLYRPSQDNAYGQYGFGLNIMEIEELSIETYKENLVRRIDPGFDDGVQGCHHFDARGDQFIIDALKVN